MHALHHILSSAHTHTRTHLFIHSFIRQSLSAQHGTCKHRERRESRHSTCGAVSVKMRIAVCPCSSVVVSAPVTYAVHCAVQTFLSVSLEDWWTSFPFPFPLLFLILSLRPCCLAAYSTVSRGSRPLRSTRDRDPETSGVGHDVFTNVLVCDCLFDTGGSMV